jgi:secernin
MLFAKSSDRPIDEPQVLRWFGRRPSAAPGGCVRATYLTVPDAGAAALLGSQPTWMWGLEHGISEHRVAIGNEKVWTVDDPRAVPPALLGMDLVRLGLERATSADAAVDAITSLLEAHGQGGSGESGADEPYWSSFLVVDPTEGWVVETSGRTWVAAPAGPGRSISNRLTLTSDWSRSSSDVPAGSDWDQRRAPDAPTGIADWRLSATRRWVALGSAATPGGAVGMLRDHGTGPWGAVGADGDGVVPPPEDIGDDWSGVTVCMHVRGYQCTTASMVVELPADPDDAVRAWASLGTPCSGVFLPVRLSGADAAVVPEVLGDLATWRSFSRLSRAVEAPGDAGAEALAAVRAALGPLETEAWELADELWAAGADADQWAAAAAGWDVAVHRALDGLGAAVRPIEVG